MKMNRQTLMLCFVLVVAGGSLGACSHGRTVEAAREERQPTVWYSRYRRGFRRRRRCRSRTWFGHRLGWLRIGVGESIRTAYRSIGNLRAIRRAESLVLVLRLAMQDLCIAIAMVILPVDNCS